jgi:hypothetical protein
VRMQQEECAQGGMKEELRASEVRLEVVACLAHGLAEEAAA